VKFIDEAIISVESGDGGNGCASFRREKYVPRGGPDGGDGGKGGDVILKSTSRRRTLYPFQFKSQFKAQRGSHGQGKQKTGKNGADLIIEIPPGTLVKDAVTHQILKDFTTSNEEFVIAKGGRGGKGNYHFRSATHRTPRFAQPGEAGQTLQLKLELKLLADVGIIGLPNAGKSTLTVNPRSLVLFPQLPPKSEVIHLQHWLPILAWFKPIGGIRLSLPIFPD
jgi:GTP-binding protein